MDNPLIGKNGAARVYGPQKGATPRMVEDLDKGLRHLSRLVAAELGKRINIPGGGAAGGLAAGALAFLNGRIVSGAESIMTANAFDRALRNADWVITGEGSFDGQSLRGKVVSGVLRSARARGVAVAVVAGTVRISRARYRRAGVHMAAALREDGMSLNTAVTKANALLFNRVRSIAQELNSRRLEAGVR